MKSTLSRTGSSEETRKSMMQYVAEPIMRENLVPLLESLIKADRALDAEAVLSDIAKLPDYRDFQRIAVKAALDCDRKDLSAKWSAMEIPIKDKAGEDDLEAMVRFPGGFMPTLVVANGKQHEAQVKAMLAQAPLSDWGLTDIFLGQELSEIMNRREGLPDKETNWLLTHTSGKAIGTGPGLPSKEALAKALEQSVVPKQADILRRFVLEHPSHYGAKETFLYELLRLAEQKTKDKLGEGAGKDKALLLNGDDDEAIWGEYARVFSQLLPYFLEKSRPNFVLASPTCSALFIHSPKMKTIAGSMLPMLEAALRRQPFSIDLWNQWFYLSALSEKANFKAFRETLAIPPFYDRLAAPPNMALWFLRDRLKADADWQGLIDVFAWVLEGWRTTFEMNPAAMNKIRWDSEWNPLLEAYLRLGKDNEANDLVNWWSASPNWGQIRPGIVDLAKKCEMGDLAERWGRM
jgi:hypothetical protein